MLLDHIVKTQIDLRFVELMSIRFQYKLCIQFTHTQFDSILIQTSEYIYLSNFRVIPSVIWITLYYPSIPMRVAFIVSYRRIVIVFTPSNCFTLSLYLTNVTFDERIFSFSPAHNSCKQMAFSRNSVILSSRSMSRWLAPFGLDPGYNCNKSNKSRMNIHVF